MIGLRFHHMETIRFNKATIGVVRPSTLLLAPPPPLLSYVIFHLGRERAPLALKFTACSLSSRLTLYAVGGPYQQKLNYIVPLYAPNRISLYPDLRVYTFIKVGYWLYIYPSIRIRREAQGIFISPNIDTNKPD